MKWTILFFSMMFSLAIMAQDKISINDLIVTRDGQFLQGQVVKVSNGTISFKYPGETTIIEVNPDQLEKIVFASGRVQNFNGNNGNSDVSKTGSPPPKVAASVENSPLASTARQSAVKPEEIFLLPDYDQNSLAVVPLSFFSNDSYNKELSSQSTAFVTDFLTQHGVKNGIGVMGLKPTIDKLVSQNISHANLQKASLEELQKTLGTRYAVSIEINEQAATAPQKPTVESFYAQTPDNEVISTKVESGRKLMIKLKIYDANLKTIVYEAVLDQNIKGAHVEQDANEEGWKASLEYLLTLFLMEEPL